MENRFLYRAKRIDNGRWVYGLPSYDTDGGIRTGKDERTKAITDWNRRANDETD